MPAQGEYDADEVGERIAAWMSTTVADGGDVDITDLDAPAETGHSSETIMFTAAWTASDGPHRERFVLRTKPTGDTVFPEYDLELQWVTMQRVAATGAAPVPTLRWLETDDSHLGSQFLVMDLVEGRVPPDRLPYTMQGWLLESDPADQRRLHTATYDTMAALHAIDWRAAGLDVLDAPRWGATGLDQQLGFYRHFLDWGAHSPQPDLEGARDWLAANRPSPEPPTALNWGDARVGNMIYEDYRPVAVIDWEMATLGPREVDLAWSCLLERFFSEFLGVDNLPGFMNQDEVIAHYESVSGYEVTDFEWYLIFGAYRYAVVMMRIIQAEQEAGIDTGFTVEDNLAINMMRTLLERHG